MNAHTKGLRSLAVASGNVTSHRMTEPMLAAVDGDGDDVCVNVVENGRAVIASYGTSEAALAFIHGYHAADKALRAQRDLAIAEIEMLKLTCAGFRAQRDELLAALRLVLDQVDYTVGACALTEMVGACLPATVIDRARAAIAKAGAA